MPFSKWQDKRYKVDLKLSTEIRSGSLEVTWKFKLQSFGLLEITLVKVYSKLEPVERNSLRVTHRNLQFNARRRVPHLLQKKGKTRSKFIYNKTNFFLEETKV